MDNRQPAYALVNMETWPRREHWAYYMNQLQAGYSLTVRLDVTRVLQFAHAGGYHFYGAMIYAITRVVNQMPALRMMVPPEGGAGIWEQMVPSFTIFHRDDETFSDLWMEDPVSWHAFIARFNQVLHDYGGCHGMKARPGQPANFFCISCIPWLDYSGYAVSADRPAALFPVILFGRYTRDERERYTLPLTLTIHHAGADGYHSCLFFEKLQGLLDHPEEWT